MAFAQAFRKHLFAAMSGGFSVPFTALAVFVDNKYAQLIFGCLAFCAAWFAAYRIWKYEREKVIELEARLGPSRKQIAVDELSRELSDAIHNLLNRNAPSADGIWKTDARTELINDIDDWFKKITLKLKDREVFTESDELHFDRLGFELTPSLGDGRGQAAAV